MAAGNFVGREREIATLTAALVSAVAGSGKICMLVGEPGIGKSRTAQEFATIAAGRGALVLWGRCYEGSGAPPYWPWIQIVRAYVETHEPAELRAAMATGGIDIAGVVPEVREKLPGLGRTEALPDPEMARFRLFDSVTAFLKEVSRRQPIVLTLDNLHAADKPSLLYLEFLSREIASSRILVVGTYRDLELTRRDPLSETLAELARESGGFQRLPLRGLAPEDVGQFIETVAGGSPPAGLVRAVHAQTEGNPLFVGEIVRLFLDEGILSPTTPLSEIGRPLRIPEGVQQVIGRRLNRLSEGCAQTLAIASVIGREFGLVELQHLIDHMTEERLLEALDEGLAARVIEELPATGRYQFSHILIRETLYDEMTATRRARLHRRIAEALEALHGSDPDAYLPQLAYHFHEAGTAGDPAKVVEYSTRAAERDMAVLAYEQAAGHCQIALAALAAVQPFDERRHCKLLLALGAAQEKAGEYPTARETYWKAAEIARNVASSEDLAAAAIGLETASWPTGGYGTPAVHPLGEALAIMDPNDLRQKAIVMGGLSRAFMLSGAFEEAAPMTRRAVEMARESGDLGALSQVMRGRSEAFFLPQTAGFLLPVADEVLRRALEVGATEAAAEGLTWSLLLQLLLGQDRNWDADFEQLQALTTQTRQPFYIVHAIATRATLAVLRGRFQEAEQLIEQTLQIGTRIKGVDPSWIYGVHMFTLRREQGRLGEVAGALAAFVGQHPVDLTWRPGLALMYAELGMESAARAEFEFLAENEFGALPQDGILAMSLSYLAEVCGFLKDKPRAVLLYRSLERFGPYCIYPGGGLCFYGSAARYLGILAATMGDLDLAAGHLEDAVAMDTRTGARTWLAHSQYEYAKLLLTRRAPGDDARAAALIDQALAATREIGMPALEARLVALEAAAHPNSATISGAAAPSYPDDLTKREVEVLRLLAAGKTNQEIGDTLFISPSTAAHHVSSIMAKTGAANRTSAANYAHSHGLI